MLSHLFSNFLWWFYSTTPVKFYRARIMWPAIRLFSKK